MERKTRIILVVVVGLVVVGVAIGLLVWGLTRGDGEVTDAPIVSTSRGTFRGVRGDGAFSMFLGIPYALVDESKPFGPSVPHPGFQEIYDANDDSTFCAQLTPTVPAEYAGVLQCLQLHIFVPDTATSQNPLPVMVWIHGGGFSQGAAAGDYPKSLALNDVVVVTINYRLGVYGFMCLDIPELPGNQGFKDQVLALRWIKEHIAAFGGDPTSITAFGQSGGSMAVNTHLYSNYEKLFDRAILQSGPALSSWYFVPSHSHAPFVLAEYFNYTPTNITDALAFLATLEPLALTKAAYDTELISAVSADNSIIRPCVEKKFEGIEQFITLHPLNIKVAPKINSSSIMIGYTDEEFGLEFYPPPEDGNYDNFEYMLNFAFVRNEAMNGTVDLVKRFYVGDEKNFGVNVRQQTANYAGDFVFAYPSHRMASQFLENGAKAVYRFVFSYIGEKNVTGASHGAELQFLFDRSQYVPTLDKNEREQRLANQVTKLWSNFAKYGNPTPEVTELLPVEWKPITRRQQFSLNLDLDIKLVSRPERRRMTFWDLFFRAYKEYEVGYEADS